MAYNLYPTADFIRQILDYNQETGDFVWRKRSVSLFTNGRQSAEHNCSIWNGKFAGKKAGCISNNGYLKIRINDTLYLGHRIAWIHYYGTNPDCDIDHLNMIRCDNKISNLRMANRSQNMANTLVHNDSTTGIKGVYFDKRRNKYCARICVSGRTLSLGSFEDPKEAGNAYIKASIKYFGAYQRG